MSKITQSKIMKIDKELSESFIRKLEMTVERYAVDQGVVIQFFNDLALYGIDEAIAYVKDYLEQGLYRYGVVEELNHISDQIYAAAEKLHISDVSLGYTPEDLAQSVPPPPGKSK